MRRMNYSFSSKMEGQGMFTRLKTLFSFVLKKKDNLFLLGKLEFREKVIFSRQTVTD